MIFFDEVWVVCHTQGRFIAESQPISRFIKRVAKQCKKQMDRQSPLEEKNWIFWVTKVPRISILLTAINLHFPRDSQNCTVLASIFNLKHVESWKSSCCVHGGENSLAATILEHSGTLRWWDKCCLEKPFDSFSKNKWVWKNVPTLSSSDLYQRRWTSDIILMDIPRQTAKKIVKNCRFLTF